MSNEHGGRPSKFNPALAEKIISCLKAGAFVTEAARASGVTKSTVWNWIARGKSTDPADEDYRKFAADVDQAEAQFEVVALRKIAGSRDWHGPQYVLAIKNPKKYGIKTRIGIEFENQKQEVLETAQQVLAPDDFLKLAAALAAKDAARNDNRGSGEDESGDNGDELLSLT